MFQSNFTDQEFTDYVNSNYSNTLSPNQIQEIADHFDIKKRSLTLRMKRKGWTNNASTREWSLTTGQIKKVKKSLEKTFEQATTSITQTVVDTVTMNAANAIVFEGATADENETTLTIIDPTADRTINLPNQSGTIPVLAAVSTTQITSTPEELNILDGVTSTAAELNILDGVTSTAAELNIMDGDTTASSTTIADADRVVVNDAGTMKQVAVTDLAAYFDDEITAMPNLVTTAATTVGALNSGSITSGFGTIDTGSSTITTTGLITGGSLDIDDVVINGTTIGHTDDTDLMTVANGLLTVAGEVSMTTLDIGGTNVTSTAAELNLVDGLSTVSSKGFAIASAIVFG